MEASLSRVLRRHYSRIGLSCFVFLAAAMLAQFIVVLLLQLFAPAAMEVGWVLTAISFLSLYAVGFPLFLLLLPKAPAQLPERAALGGFGELCVCLLMCLGILYPGNLLGQGATRLVSRFLGAGGSSPLDAYLGRMDLWAVVLFAVVLAPIMEEVVFRRLLLDRMRTIDRPTAVLFSALVFGLFHGNLGQFFYAFGVGVLLGCIYVRTGRLRYTILLHLLVNAIGSLVPMLLLGEGDVDLQSLTGGGTEALSGMLEQLPSLLGLGVFSLCVLCCSVAGIVLLVRRLPGLLRRRPEDRLGEPVLAFRTLFLNGGFLAFLLASALEVVLSLLLN